MGQLPLLHGDVITGAMRCFYKGLFEVKIRNRTYQLGRGRGAIASAQRLEAEETRKGDSGISGLTKGPKVLILGLHHTYSRLHDNALTA